MFKIQGTRRLENLNYAGRHSVRVPPWRFLLSQTLFLDEQKATYWRMRVRSGNFLPGVIGL